MSSLRNFNFTDVVKDDDVRESYIDTLVLHSPMASINETMEVWQTLEQYVPKEIKNLGISNCNLFTLMDIYERSRIKPSVVQNRFYPATKFDIGLRKFCQEKGIVYQSFWTLSANPNLVWSTEVGQLASQTGISQQAALYCLVLGLGNVTILNGTKSIQHMKDDWKALEKVKAFATLYPEAWEHLMARFRILLGYPSV
jgi:diketogulonate reductase-like aldo/keto reductase